MDDIDFSRSKFTSGERTRTEELERALIPNFKLRGRPYFSPLPAFDADAPEVSLQKVPCAPLRPHAPLSQRFVIDGNFAPKEAIDRCETEEERRSRELEFCETAPEMLVSLMSTFAWVVSQSQSESSSIAKERLLQAFRACGEKLSEDPNTLDLLKEMAETLVEQLDRATEKYPEETKALARTEMRWPSLVGPRKSQQKQTAEYIEALELARQYIAAPSKKGADRTTEANAFSDALVNYLGQIRDIDLTGRPANASSLKNVVNIPVELFDEIQSLDELDDSSAEAWFDTAWKLLLHVTSNEPQTYEILEGLGAFRVLEVEERSKGSVSLEARENAAQNGIKKVLRQSFKTIARERG